MLKSKRTQAEKLDRDQYYNCESPDMLLAEIMYLEAQCHALQEYNSELEESRNRYVSVFDHSPVGYVILDGNGVIHDANLTVATMVEMQQEHMVGLPFAIAVAKRDTKLFFDHLRLCEVTKARVCTELTIKSCSHKMYSVQLVSFPFNLLDCKTVHYNTAIIDISNQKRLEEELQRLDRLNLVGEMAAGIAHEIRNPMTTVHGYLQLFKRKSTWQQDKEDIQLMIEELDRANAIITEFLALAKNKRNKLVRENVNSMVQAVFPLVQAEAIIAGSDVLLELTPDLPETLIDGKEMRQVLLNLVGNALQAMHHGQVIIRTFMEDGKVVLAVEDQGYGIPEEIRHKIGTPFFTTKDSGTGLGMAICYSIIQRHNAKLDFTSGPSGTTFFIRFPR